jgi:hypothetical protein
MADPIDLTSAIAGVVDGAAGRGRPLAIAYVDDDGSPALSFRGSMQVYGGDRLALWARKADSGIAAAVAKHPNVSVIFFDPEADPRYISIRGRAHVDPSANDTVYDAMIQGERDADADRNGVAIIIDVDSVAGGGSAGFFQQQR